MFIVSTVLLGLLTFGTAFVTTAAGVFAVMEAMGAVAGMLLVYSYERTEKATSVAGVVPPIALLVIGAAALLLLFPETKQRELEAIGVR